jgi:hypothetical protein
MEYIYIVRQSSTDNILSDYSQDTLHAFSSEKKAIEFANEQLEALNIIKKRFEAPLVDIYSFIECVTEKCAYGFEIERIELN